MSNKNILSFAAIFLAAQFCAQSSAFNNTTWKIEFTSAAGKTILKKSKKVNLSTDEIKFHYLQFEGDHYRTGTSCFSMNGSYQVYEDQTIEFSEGMMAMSGDCKELKNLIGSYSYILKQDKIELTPVKNNNEEENTETADISYEADGSLDAVIEAAAAVKEAAQEAQNPSRKSRKK